MSFAPTTCASQAEGTGTAIQRGTLRWIGMQSDTLKVLMTINGVKGLPKAIMLKIMYHMMALAALNCQTVRPLETGAKSIE